MTSKKSPAVTIAKTRECVLPIAALSSVVSTYSTIDCANVLSPSRRRRSGPALCVSGYLDASLDLPGLPRGPPGQARG